MATSDAANNENLSKRQIRFSNIYRFLLCRFLCGYTDSSLRIRVMHLLIYHSHLGIHMNADVPVINCKGYGYKRQYPTNTNAI